MRGFTLIELVIGMAIFGLVMLGAVATYTGIVRMQQKAAVAQTVQQEARYTLETITRDARVAFNAEVLPTELILTGSLASDSKVRYYYNAADSKVYREECGISCGANGAAITSDSVRVTNLNFTEQVDLKSSIRLDLTVEQAAVDLAEEDPYFFRYNLTTVVTTRG